MAFDSGSEPARTETAITGKSERAEIRIMRKEIGTSRAPVRKTEGNFGYWVNFGGVRSVVKRDFEVVFFKLVFL